MSNFHVENKKKNFFEGWYFKHQKDDKTVSFIPGVSIGKDGNKISFIQVITKEKAYDIHYTYSQFNIEEGNLNFKVGNSTFSDKGIDINIETVDLSITGKIQYSSITPIDYDIMGPFSKIPFMECNHGIVSLYHKLKGTIFINGEEFSFDEGVGYIEKDWGKSFPKNYIWIQCNDFQGEKSSIMASIANIPFLGLKFNGCIASIYHNGREYRMATYNGVKIIKADENGMILKKGNQRLEIDILKNIGHKLRAPKNGLMSRNIREHPSCKATFKLYIDDKLEFNLKSNNCSFEYVTYSRQSL